MAKKKTSKGPKVFKRRDGRYAVLENGKPVNGAEKVKVLSDKGLVKAPAVKKVDEPEATAEDQTASE